MLSTPAQRHARQTGPRPARHPAPGPPAGHQTGGGADRQGSGRRWSTGRGRQKKVSCSAVVALSVRVDMVSTIVGTHPISSDMNSRAQDPTPLHPQPDAGDCPIRNPCLKCCRPWPSRLHLRRRARAGLSYRHVWVPSSAGKTSWVANSSSGRQAIGPAQRVRQQAAVGERQARRGLPPRLPPCTPTWSAHSPWRFDPNAHC